MDLTLLKELWLQVMEPGADDLEEAWREAQKEFTVAKMVGEILEADYEGAFSGQSGGRTLPDKVYDYLHDLRVMDEETGK